MPPTIHGQIRRRRFGVGAAVGFSTLPTSFEPSSGLPHCVQFLAFAPIGALHAGHVRSEPS